MTSKLLAVAIASALSAVTVSAQAAGSIVGGSALLDTAGVASLDGWLGKGDFVLTKIFTKADGSTPYDFHKAVDGKGPTISVFTATYWYGGSAIVGGYNPFSWDSTDTYRTTSDRSAFIFNLTDHSVFRQVDGVYGDTQTYNGKNYGPTFGQGHDLVVDTTGGLLGEGYSYLFSYTGKYDRGYSIVNGCAYGSGGCIHFSVGLLEVFTVTAVPEPETYALFLAGLGVLGGIARSRKARAA